MGDTIRLNDLHPKPGSAHRRKRRGRGVGSGHGKTGTRGQKGQKSRSGVSNDKLSSGQTPITRQKPKRGANQGTEGSRYSIVNIQDLTELVRQGRIVRGQIVDQSTLVRLGLASKKPNAVKILGSGDIDIPLYLSVAKASENAIRAIRNSGGDVFEFENSKGFYSSDVLSNDILCSGEGMKRTIYVVHGGGVIDYKIRISCLMKDVEEPGFEGFSFSIHSRGPDFETRVFKLDPEEAIPVREGLAIFEFGFSFAAPISDKDPLSYSDEVVIVSYYRNNPIYSDTLYVDLDLRERSTPEKKDQGLTNSNKLGAAQLDLDM